MKKRISIWLHGGIGTGHFSQGYPMLQYLFEGLSESFEISVYSHSAIDEGYTNNKILIRTSRPTRKGALVRWVDLVILFFRDHRKKKFDIIIGFWGWPAGFIVVLLGKIFHIPSAVYVLGGDAAGIPSINYGILHKPLLRRIAFWTYKACTLLLGISFYQNDQLHAFGLRRKADIIPWGADPSLYRFHYKIPGNVLHFIHVGHLTPVKDQSTLLKAFALINARRPSELCVIGTDCLDGAAQRLCQSLGIHQQVKFLGMIPYSQMPAYYTWAHIMLHTSLSEGQSMALTEAAACGVLMAGTRVGLLYDLRDDCAITVDFGDHEGLAKQILEILNNQDAWNKKLYNAKAWSEQHTLDWTVRELTKRLNSL